MASWAKPIAHASTEKELCAALRAVPVAHGTVLYDALDNTLGCPSCYPSADEVLAIVRGAQAERPVLWSLVCVKELRQLIARLGHAVTLREWVPGARE